MMLRKRLHENRFAFEETAIDVIRTTGTEQNNGVCGCPAFLWGALPARLLICCLWRIFPNPSTETGITQSKMVQDNKCSYASHCGETGTHPAHLFSVYFVADCHCESVYLKLTLVKFAANGHVGRSRISACYILELRIWSIQCWCSFLFHPSLQYSVFRLSRCGKSIPGQES